MQTKILLDFQSNIHDFVLNTAKKIASCTKCDFTIVLGRVEESEDKFFGIENDSLVHEFELMILILSTLVLFISVFFCVVLGGAGDEG